MSGRSIRSAFIFLFLFSYCSAVSWCADRNGTYDTDCQTEYLHLRASRDGKETPSSGKQELSLVYRHAFPSPPLSGMGWIPAEGKSCMESGTQCVPLPSVKVRFDSEDGKKRLTGAFAVDYPKGGHEEGTFILKYQHHGSKAKCL